MKVNKLIASAVVSAILALEAWTLTTVIDLKVQVAQIGARLPATKIVAIQADNLVPGSADKLASK